MTLLPTGLLTSDSWIQAGILGLLGLPFALMGVLKLLADGVDFVHRLPLRIAALLPINHGRHPTLRI